MDGKNVPRNETTVELPEWPEDRPVRWMRFWEVFSDPGRSRWLVVADLALWVAILAASVGPLIYLLARQLIVGLAR